MRSDCRESNSSTLFAWVLLGALFSPWMTGLAFAQDAESSRRAAKFEKRQQQKMPGVKIVRDLVYTKAGESELKLDLYLPEKADRPVPLIIWVHGGGWRRGSKEKMHPPVAMLNHGYAGASINYRLTDVATFPAQIEDCKAAVRWLRANAEKYNLDPDHFGAWGPSAGGHLVALMGTSGDVKEWDKGEHLDQSSKVQAVCDFYGPTDLLKMGARHLQPDSPESLLVGGPILENKERADAASPIRYVSPMTPPFFIVHGAKDGVVPVTQSELLVAALEKAGVPVELVVIPEANHGGREFVDPKLIEKVEGFFDQHLKPASEQKPSE